MRRRDLIAMLTWAAIAAARAAIAQQPAMPVIGFLNSGTTSGVSRVLPGFLQGLADSGFVEGRNVTIEYRIADGHFERLPDYAADLVRRRVGVISAGGGDLPAQAAEAKTHTIPIVFTIGSDPVAAGLVASFNRPGGNATGISMLLTKLELKRLEILHEGVPAATSLGVLLETSADSSEIETAARSLGLSADIARVKSETDLDGAFARFHEHGVGAVLIGSNPVLAGWGLHVLVLANSYSLPVAYEFPEAASAGALISYGPSIADAYRQAGIYAGRILKGEKPADLPVLQPTKFLLIINLKTAKALGLSIPPTLLATADEVIE